MADQVQFRGGTAAENDAFTGVTKEITVDTTNKQLRVHDGAKQGGFPMLGERQLKHVDTYSALKALEADGHEQAYVRGRSSVGDGAHGVFVWRSGDQSANVTADPGEGVWVPPDSDATGASGAWERQVSGAANVLWFGAVGDGVANDSPAIQNAVNAQDEVYLPPGHYRCEGQVLLRGGVTLIGAGKGVTRIEKIVATYGGVIVADSGSTTAQLSDITIRDMTLFDDVETLLFQEQQHLMSLHGVDNVLVNNVEFIGFRGDGLYVGEGNDAVRTRVNTRIVISECLFDGINNDNRQGVTIVSGEYITITGNTFQNTTRSDMPGAINLEPDTSSTSVISNITITNNRFFNIGGNVGVIAAVIPATAALFSNILISDNTIRDGDNASAIAISNRITGLTPNSVVIANNVVAGAKRFFDLGRVLKGVTVSGNSANHSSSSLLGAAGTYEYRDVVISNNTFTCDDGASTAGGLVLRGKLDGVSVIGNAFSNWNDFCVSLGGDTDSDMSRIVVASNVAQGLRGAQRFMTTGAGTINGETCAEYGNIGGAANKSKFWMTDRPDVTVNSDTAESFNSATLPDSFPVGTSTAVINGDTGVPNTGGRQGTLRTVRPASAGGYAKWTYQLYIPANNGSEVGTFYVRKREAASNTWSSWYKVAGVL